MARAFWNSPRPSRTATVPACAVCEDKFKREESYFRNTIVALAGDTHPAAKALLKDKMIRGLARNPAELSDITRGVQHGSRRNAASGVFKPASRFLLDVPRLSRCVEKVVRGLFFFTRERPLSATHAVTVLIGNTFWEDSVTKTLIEAMAPFAGYGDGETVFAARTVKDNADPDTSAWVLVFYRSVGFFALTCPRDAMELSLKTA